MQRVKQEYRDGFLASHDNIVEAKDVLESKRLLLEEQLRKEISQLRKMIVLM